MEQTCEDLTQNLKCENENSEMDIEGNVIKVELKPALSQIQKLPNKRQENANIDKHAVESESDNQANDESQNTLSIEQTMDLKLENEEIKSYICGKQSNSKENSPALKRKSTKKAKVTEQNICEICKKAFSKKFT